MANRILQRVIVGVLISIILGFYHQVVKADTYTAAYMYNVRAETQPTPDPQAACTNALPYYPGGTQAIITNVNPPYQIKCKILNVNNATLKSDTNMSYTMGCPGGGTYASGSCINAPACIEPNVRRTQLYNANYGLCVAPVECAYPLSDNGSGTCTDNQCPAGQVRVPSDNLCHTPVACNTSVETYNTFNNTCTLNPLVCGNHRHANETNTECVWDAPLTCPDGQHDDGTYTCVANEALSCPPGWAYGRINNTPQCIEPSHLDTKQQAAYDAAQTAHTANNNLNSAQQYYEQKRQEYLANPNDPVTIQNYTNAQTQLSNAQSSANTANNDNQKAQTELTNARQQQANTDQVNSDATTHKLLGDANGYLKSIDDGQKKEAADTASAVAKGIGAFGTIENVPMPGTSVNVTNPLAGGGGGSSGSAGCPAADSISVGGVSISLGPLMGQVCSLVAAMRPIMVASAYVLAAYIFIGVI